MQAEDLHVVPAVTWGNDHNTWAPGALPKEPLVRFDENRFCHLLGAQHVRPGGTLYYFKRQ